MKNLLKTDMGKLKDFSLKGLLVLIALTFFPSNGQAQCLTSLYAMGGITYCPGDPTSSFKITLRGTRSDYQYKLYKNGTYTGRYRYGNDSWSENLYFENLSVPGRFTIHAVKSGCNEVVSNEMIYSQSEGIYVYTHPGGDFNFCEESGGLIRASAPAGASFQWYERIGTDRVIPGATGSELVVQHTGYYSVKVTNQCGSATSNTIKATLLSPSPPEVQQPYVIPYNTSATLTATGAENNETYRWYTSPTGGTPLSTTNTPKLKANTTYYVSIYSICESDRTPFMVTVNRYPSANAGADQSIELPTRQVVLNGSGSDADGTITSYYWEQVSGPPATIPSNTGASITVTELVAGTYIFRLTVKDNYNYESSDEVQVTVSYPSNNYNYIETSTVLAPGVTATPQLLPLPVEKKSVSTTYFDGLGRPMQKVGWQASPAGHDIAQPILYDVYGRQAKKYLPFSSTDDDGWYKPNSNIVDPGTGNYIGTAGAFYAPGSDNEVADDLRPYAETVFEPSPLNRPSKVYDPGKDWHDKGKFIKHEYLTNIHDSGAGEEDGERVIAWELNASGLPVRMGAVEDYIETGGYYSTGQLYVKSTRDEHGNEVREYTNKTGQLILKKVQVEGNAVLNDPAHWAQTYYIYDDLGNLRFVLQPKLVKTLLVDGDNPTLGELNGLAFQYKYDNRKRMTEKKVPGADWVYMVYDERDRLVLTQDGNQRNPGQEEVKSWTFTKYDALNRPVLTGKYEDGTAGQSTMQAAVTTFYNGAEPDDWYEERGGNVHGYTNRSFPPVSDANACLTVTYYDDYTFRDVLPGFGSSYDYQPGQLGCKTTQAEYCFPPAENQNVKGQVTGTKIKVLNESKWIKTVNYYDKKYRLIQTVTENQFVKKDIFSTLYDFTGKVLKTLLVHNSNTQTDLKVYNEFAYDHAGRLLDAYQQIGDSPSDKVLMASNEYNALGELVRKNLHKTDAGQFMQSVDYRYNIRGWLTRINNSDLSPDANQATEDYFGMGLYYNYGFDVPQYNGNIAGVRWKNSVDQTERAYGYTYDPLNRLTGADYVAGGTANWTQETDRFEVGNLNYDMNGNIQNLDRNGLFRKLPGQVEEYGVVDQLDYKYVGNQLMAVNDAITTPSATKSGFRDNGSEGSLASPEYAYDFNGNMTLDGNKGITVSYNHLNLPMKVDFGFGKYIEYIYDAVGIKLAQKVYEDNAPVKETKYNGGFIYEDGVLQFMQTPEGRVVADRDYDGSFEGWEYQYHLKDHLGNVRLTFTTAKEEMLFEATMESEYAALEEVMYSNLAETRHTDLNANHTVDISITANEAASLNGTDPARRVGPAIMLPVYPGDKVNIEVYASYTESTGGNAPRISAAVLTTAVAAAFGGSPTGTEQAKAIYNAISGALALGGGAIGNPDPEVPQAFVNYLLFDENMMPIASNEGGFGFDAVSDIGQQTPETGARHDKLQLGPVDINKEGFIYIYLSNESDVDVNVYFDDMKVTLIESPIMQADDYYPFGLTFNSFFREGGKENRFLYNSKELQTDFDLGLYDYGARMYDASLGRWNHVDPLADKYFSLSPYAYVANNPINAIDPDGKRIIFVNGYIGFGSPPAGAEYWNGTGYNPALHRESDFVRGAKSYLNDNSTYYTDVSYGWYQTAFVRRGMGEKYARENLKSLTQGLDKEKDIFHFVTHSMGGAFAQGIKNVLEEEGWTIGHFIGLNTFEAGKINFEEGDQAYVVDFKNTDDPVLMLLDPNFGNDEIGNSDLIIRDKSGEKLQYIHRSPIDNGEQFWNKLQQVINQFLNEENKKDEEEN